MQKNTKWIGFAFLGAALLLMTWQTYDQGQRQKVLMAEKAKIEAAQTAENAKKSALSTPVSISSNASFVATQVPVATKPISAAEENNPLVIKPAPALAEEKLTTLENNFLLVQFTSRGGAIRSVAFKQYPATQGGRNPYVLQAPERLPFCSLNFSEQPDSSDLNSYALISQTDDSITYARTVASGITLEHKYTLTSPEKDRTANGYLIKQTLSWHNVSANDLQLPKFTFNIGTALPMASDPQNMFLNFGSYNGKDAKFESLAYFKGGSFLFWKSPARSSYEVASPTVWASLDNQFFSIIGTPKVPALGAVASPVMTGGDNPQEAISGSLVFDKFIVGAAATVTTEVDTYIGPKEYARIASLPNRQDEVMQWGWPIFSFFGKLFISMLNGIARAVQNYGVAIIILTLIIRAAMWPFTASAAQASKKMAAVQPLLKELQAKYKNSPEKLQRETVRIFQENQVNPLAGCLPALLQIPVFIGFFYMLRSAAELRFESFLWIRDLSMPDTIAHLWGFPINPLPVVMLVTMWYQMKLTPSAGDPEQQKIMQFTPFLFSFLLYNFSAGLTLYWTLSNVVSIIQQLIINNQVIPPADSKGGSGNGDGVIDVKATEVK